MSGKECVIKHRGIGALGSAILIAICSPVFHSRTALAVAASPPVALLQTGAFEIPDSGSHPEIWDFAAHSSGLYFLLAAASGSSECVHTTLDGRLVRRIALAPSPAPARSGAIRVSPAGQVAILKKMRSGPEISVYDGGRIVSTTTPSGRILELTYFAERLIGASSKKLLQLNAAGETGIAAFNPELEYPFTLLSLPAGKLSAIEWPGGLLRTQIDTSADNRPKTIDYPETRERTPAQIGQGAAAMFMVTADEHGNIYCGLPNFRPSHDVRVLILNQSGERERVVSFPLMQNGSAHAHPRYLRVAGGVLYTSALRSPIIRYFKLN